MVDLDIICMEPLHGLPHTRVSGQHSTFHSCRRWPWNQINYSPTACFAGKTTGMVHPAKHVCVQSAERVACHLAQKIPCNHLETERFPKVSCLYSFQVLCHAMGKVKKVEILPPCKRIILSWTASADHGFQDACSRSINFGCVFSYLHLYLIFTRKPFPSHLLHSFHHGKFFAATIELTWSALSFSRHSASLCQIIWILHSTDLLLQLI